MTNREKAKIILNSLDRMVQIDFNFQDFYIKAIERGLEEINKKENAK